MMVWFSLSIGLVRRVKMQVEMRHRARQSWKIWLWIPSILEIVSILPSFMDLVTVLATLNTKGKKSGLFFKVSKISCFVWIEGWFTTTDFEQRRTLVWWIIVEKQNYWNFQFSFLLLLNFMLMYNQVSSVLGYNFSSSFLNKS